MSIFPTQYSTLSAKALGEHIATKYGLPVTRCRYLLRGVSDTYVVETDADKYIFKVYRDVHRTADEIRGEIELLDILKAGAAKVSYPIYDLKGEALQAFTAVEGVRHGVLFSYAKGESHLMPNGEQLRVLGREMAFNHRITEGLKLSYPRRQYDMEWALDRPLRVVAPAFEGMEKEYAALQEKAEAARAKMAQTDVSAFGYGYLHFDYFSKNFFYDDQNNLTLFDFDFAGEGLLMYDLASFHVYQYMLQFNNRKTAAETGHDLSVVLSGYRELRALNEEELAIMPWLGFMLMIFYIGFQYENFDDFSNTYFTPGHVKRFTEIMLQYFDAYCGKD
ncbi:MAG: phosphotransferase [Bacteroidetes bacterium]|nr:phosphotransferase [Bacteroidota bacterium]